MDPSARPVAEPRCYFALLDERLHFRYLDPVFRACLGEVRFSCFGPFIFRLHRNPRCIPSAVKESEKQTPSRQAGARKEGDQRSLPLNRLVRADACAAALCREGRPVLQSWMPSRLSLSHACIQQTI